MNQQDVENALEVLRANGWRLVTNRLTSQSEGTPRNIVFAISPETAAMADERSGNAE